MKNIVIYKGRYGATEQYANWLGEELNVPVKGTHELASGDLRNNEMLVIGSSVYIGVLTIKEWVKQNMAHLAGKKIFLFIVCGTPLHERQKLSTYVASSIPSEILNNCSIYYLPGRITFNKLSFSDKLMLRIGYFLSSKKQKETMNVADHDFVNKENLKEIIADVTKALHKKELRCPAVDPGARQIMGFILPLVVKALIYKLQTISHSQKKHRDTT